MEAGVYGARFPAAVVFPFPPSFLQLTASSTFPLGPSPPPAVSAATASAHRLPCLPHTTRVGGEPERRRMRLNCKALSLCAGPTGRAFRLPQQTSSGRPSRRTVHRPTTDCRWSRD